MRWYVYVSNPPFPLTLFAMIISEQEAEAFAADLRIRHPGWLVTVHEDTGKVD